MENEKKKKSKKLPIFLGVLVVACAGAYSAVAMHYQDLFLPNTTVNGVDASQRSWSDVQTELEAMINTYKLDISTRNGIKDIVNAADIDMKTDFGEQIREMQEAQNEWLWPMAYYQGEEKSELSYDKEKLDQMIEAMNCMDEEQAKAPEDAYLSEYEEGKGYSVIPEVENNLLKKPVFEEIVTSALSRLDAEIAPEVFEEADAYEHPTVFSDDKVLNNFVAQANRVLNVNLIYKFGDDEEIVNGSVIKDLIDTDDEGNVTVNPDKTREYINSLARKYETFGSSRTFKTTYGPTVKIPNGDYGWWMNRSKTTEDLLAALEAGEDKELEVTYYQKAASFSENDYGNSYVEINLTAQHLYLYVDGKMTLSTDFVSGKPSIKMTPTGVYPITAKDRAHTMKGDASDPYRVETCFWMPFCGGVGMHDATWRTRFGATLYKTEGSHGCINLPYNAAKTIYYTVSEGWPVIVYQFDGTATSHITSQGDSEIANFGIDAIDRINALPWDNFENAKKRVEWARQVYKDLSPAQRKLVTNYKVLVEAEKKVAEH